MYNSIKFIIYNERLYIFISAHASTITEGAPNIIINDRW